VFDPMVGPPPAVVTGYTQAFAEAIIKEAEADSRVVAITAAMPGPTGLLPFQARFPDRFFDVGIAEQHAVTGAAGMAMGGLRPVVAIYSTFLNRAWDQVVYDVAMHRLPVVFCLDRAGITGPDGCQPPRRVRPGAAGEGARHARAGAVQRRGTAGDAARRHRRWPTKARWPSAGRAAAAVHVGEHEVGTGLLARQVRKGDGSVCILAIGKMVADAQKAAEALAAAGIEATVWDVRSCAPLDPAMIADAAAHGAVRHGGGRHPRRRHRHDRSPIRCTRSPPPCRCRCWASPRSSSPRARPSKILAQLGLDADGISTAARTLLG
jgi:1-deoxy-D-xylulose-5-phosphate synthase